jgi:hypothetical protein
MYRTSSFWYGCHRSNGINKVEIKSGKSARARRFSRNENVDGLQSGQDDVSIFTNLETTKYNKQQIRILSLDNIGVRGRSTIMILERIMTEVQKQQKLAEVPHPHSYFDLICGTGTGGIIALMLGRLKMVITHFMNLRNDSFRLYKSAKRTITLFARNYFSFRPSISAVE